MHNAAASWTSCRLLRIDTAASSWPSGVAVKDAWWSVVALSAAAQNVSASPMVAGVSDIQQTAAVLAKIPQTRFISQML